jgi:hydroxyethylthiazole kinase
MSTQTPLPERTWDDADTQRDVAAVRAAAPLVHCLTNYVAAPLTANVLLAAGAVPAMVAAIEEVSAFATVAGGVLLNVGTVTTETANPFIHAAAAAERAGTPWVLDPVAVGAGLRLRDRVAAELLEYRPTIIRGNGSEILGLSGCPPSAPDPRSAPHHNDQEKLAMPLASALVQLLADPIDHGPLAIVGDTILYNPRLRHAYPVADGIPQLIADKAAPASDADHDRYLAAATGWTREAQ